MDAVTSANTGACPYCGSHQPRLVVSERTGEKSMCPECSYIVSSWSVGANT